MASSCVSWARGFDGWALPAHRTGWMAAGEVVWAAAPGPCGDQGTAGVSEGLVPLSSSVGATGCGIEAPSAHPVVTPS